MEEDITPLLQEIAAIMADDALFVVLTSYARSSFLSLHHAMDAALSGMGGAVSSGELAVRETTPRQYRPGQAIFARWRVMALPFIKTDTGCHSKVERSDRPA